MLIERNKLFYVDCHIKIYKSPTYAAQISDLGPRVHVHPLERDPADVENPKHAAHPRELVHHCGQLTSLYLK